jgi:hypothetical protein
VQQFSYDLCVFIIFYNLVLLGFLMFLVIIQLFLEVLFYTAECLVHHFFLTKKELQKRC